MAADTSGVPNNVMRVNNISAKAIGKWMGMLLLRCIDEVEIFDRVLTAEE